MRSSPALALLTAALLSAALAACGGKDAAVDGDGHNAGDPSALPAPEGGRGSITGMPDAGQPGPAGAPAATPPQLDENGNPLPPTDPNAAPDPNAPVDPAAPVPAAQDPAAVDAAPANPADPAAAAGEPTAEDAVAVVRDYYAAINAHRYERAYALWSDGGRASGQDAQQFANGFAQTAGVSVELAPAGRVDAGAGQRHIEVPVSVTATQRDGSQRRFVGAYTLRRTMVDGASAEQRAWRIASADIRELKP
ncbi:hypothetical protein J5226_23150 [Lysobacter sp. K5869]|uniref:hypothetical protein n=1 Tax=Lysobacter sp. K5869 TaxID=2820808 RepID=UPI001C0603EC|nr:hypothetical protein [Lysobacter sp. K5869]QWP76447.1 hypothetical protein J5226_23150 [Lysobacter sp. K5869]